MQYDEPIHTYDEGDGVLYQALHMSSPSAVSGLNSFLPNKQSSGPLKHLLLPDPYSHHHSHTQTHTPDYMNKVRLISYEYTLQFILVRADPYS